MITVRPMAETYTKLASTITDSSIWAESLAVRVVWITMMAMADEEGRVRASLSGLARRANVPADDVRDALARFLAPDPDSTSPEHEGRRVQRVEGGWRLLNHAKYRAWGSRESRREYERERKANRRASRSVPACPDVSQPVPDCPGFSAQADSEAKAKAEALPHTPLSGGRTTKAPIAYRFGGDHASLDIYRRQLIEELGVDLPRWKRKGSIVETELEEVLGDLEAAGFKGQAGVERLMAVIRHAAILVRDGKLHPGNFSGMFHEGGWSARYSAFVEHESGQHKPSKSSDDAINEQWERYVAEGLVEA